MQTMSNAMRIPPAGYQARTVHEGTEYELGRHTGHADAIAWAEMAGPGSYVVAVAADGTPLTRDDGTEYVARTIDQKGTEWARATPTAT